MLVDAPYPDDGVSPSGEEPVKSWVELESIHPISIVLLHLISNDIGHLTHREGSEQTSCARLDALTYWVSCTCTQDMQFANVTCS